MLPNFRVVLKKVVLQVLPDATLGKGLNTAFKFNLDVHG